MTDKKFAKQKIDSLITKARVHLYKPIQIAEILYYHRTKGSINLLQLEDYRNPSKVWRDVICRKFIGRTSTSSARYQDDIFNDNAIPPNVLDILGEINVETNGGIEAYIYSQFSQRLSQVFQIHSYCSTHNKHSFQVSDLLGLFRRDPGLTRSVDKIYEIVVYALFSSLVDELEVTVEVSLNESKLDVFEEFSDFALKILQLSIDKPKLRTPARINRVGVTNAADRGLDMWANYGLAIQIKHLSLDEGLAEDIVNTITADRIVIVCRDAEQKVIVSLLNQIGWKSKIQSVVTETDLINWYEKALRGKYSNQIGDKLISNVISEIEREFPSSNNVEFQEFITSRNYDQIDLNAIWK